MTGVASSAAGELPRAWLQAHADGLCSGESDPALIVPALAAAGLFRVGVPTSLGGAGGDVRDAIRAIAAVAEESVTAAFVYWGQRTFIEYLLESDDAALRERWLPALLDGRLAGATGLSNAMKYLSGIETLQIEAHPESGGWRLEGAIPWVTNLRPSGFVVAVAVSQGNAPAAIAAVESSRTGLERSADLDLLALRSSNTAALAFRGVSIEPSDIIDLHAEHFLPRVRPAFVGLQCGLSIGLARAGLNAARVHSAKDRAVLPERIARLEGALEASVERLLAGVADGRFRAAAPELFRLRIELAEWAQRAVELELHASGGRAYLRPHNAGFARRWREAAFIPVLTPSITQLQGELLRCGERLSS